MNTTNTIHEQLKLLDNEISRLTTAVEHIDDAKKVAEHATQIAHGMVTNFQTLAALNEKMQSRVDEIISAYETADFVKNFSDLSEKLETTAKLEAQTMATEIKQHTDDVISKIEIAGKIELEKIISLKEDIIRVNQTLQNISPTLEKLIQLNDNLSLAISKIDEIKEVKEIVTDIKLITENYAKTSKLVVEKVAEIQKSVGENHEKTAVLIKEKTVEIQKTVGENQEKTAALIKEETVEIQKSVGENQEKTAALIKEKTAEIQKSVGENQEKTAALIKEKTAEIQKSVEENYEKTSELIVEKVAEVQKNVMENHVEISVLISQNQTNMKILIGLVLLAIVLGIVGIFV